MKQKLVKTTINSWILYTKNK